MSSSPCPVRSTPMTSVESCAATCRHPDVGVFDHDRPLRTHMEPARGFDQDGGTGFPGSPSSSATTPSTRTPKRSLIPAARRTFSQLRLDEKTAMPTPTLGNFRTRATVESNSGTPSAKSPRNGCLLTITEPADTVAGAVGRKAR